MARGSALLLHSCSQSNFASVKLKNSWLAVRHYVKGVKYDSIGRQNRDNLPGVNSAGLDRKSNPFAAIQYDVNSGNAKKATTEDNRFLEITSSIKSHSKREKLGVTYITGASLISEAISKGAVVKEIYYANHQLLQAVSYESLEEAGVPFFRISRDFFNKHLNSKLETDGLLAVIAIPFTRPVVTESNKPLPLTVVCDNIRDPGNMGMLIQSSVAASCEKILVTKGCVDIWEPKVLQVGKGAHFSASIETNLDWKEISNYIPSDSCMYLADSSHSEDSELDSTENVVSGKQIKDYDCVHYSKSHTTLVIGGETHGLSQEAYDLCFSKGESGQRIHIPMMSGVNSLNSAVAASVILFEISRQLKQCAK